ncbi:MAG: hypothetical protein M3N18_09435 [Actinomycetota bacterium]|nr:hypothetical protein [Actinomycetota bacterium]
MDFLSNLMGGERREAYGNFAERYDRGAPYDDISDEETIDRYREVAPELSEEDYRDAAREAFSRLAPEERLEFGRQLREESLQQGCDLPGRGADDEDERFEDPDYLARVTGRVHREQPELLESLLIGGGDGLIGGMMGDGITGGEGASGGEPMTDNLVVKAVLAGIVATAVKRAMSSG